MQRFVADEPLEALDAQGELSRGETAPAGEVS
jgi:hypothetical protein